MECDMKNCRLWVDGECTDEEEREKCPLMEARMDCRAVDDLLSKALRDLARYNDCKTCNQHCGGCDFELITSEPCEWGWQWRGVNK